MCVCLIVTAFVGCSKANENNLKFSSTDIISDKEQFAINNNIYTIGETTLQEMIDDGVTFSSDEYLNSVVSPDSPSKELFVLGNDDTSLNSVALTFYNNTTDELNIKDCVIQQVDYTVYSNASKKHKSKPVVQFNFPYSITESNLKIAVGEPDDYQETSSLHKYEYNKVISNDNSLKYTFFFDLDGNLTKIIIKNVILVDVTADIADDSQTTENDFYEENQPELELDF